MASQDLPKNEAHRFLTMMDMVDRRRYSKALKTADEILKKFPDHGETMAVKGLIKYHIGRTTKGYKLVRKGLGLNVTSSTSWHILATMYRADRCNYRAVECYRVALNLDSKNERIMRDYAPILIHIRDYSGYFDIRRKLFNIRPDQHMNWFFMAVAAHLNGFYDYALTLLTQIENLCFEDSKTLKKWENKLELSQIILYKIYTLKNKGDFDMALNYLESVKSQVLDQITLQEIRAELLLALGNFSEAEAQYRELLKFNPENLDYHIGIQKSLSISACDSLTQGQIDQLDTLYGELSMNYPNVITFRLYPLFYWISGEKFKAAFTEYIKPLLSRNIPSLWKTLRTLYKFPEKIQIIEEFILSCEASLKFNSTFPGSDEKCGPTTILWVYYFLAQHFKLSDLSKSLYYIDLAIEHTPTLLDFYIFKASVHKSMGNYMKSGELMELARTLDLSDRYTNNKSVKYWLRADQIDKAISNFTIFTDVDRVTYNSAYSMQIMWFETSLAKSYERLNQLALALKYYKNVDEHFFEFKEDQFDFHGYCLRKLTLITYNEMIKSEMKDIGSKYYIRALKGLIRIYLHLHNMREKMTPEEIESMTQKGIEAHRAAMNTQKTSKKPWNKKYDPDPVGEISYSTKYEMQLASDYSKNLLDCSKKDSNALILIVKVFKKCDKPLLALSALLSLIKLGDLRNPKAHYALVYFLQWWRSVETDHHQVVSKIVQNNINPHIGPDTNLLDYNTHWIKNVAEPCYLSKLMAAKIIIKWSQDKSHALELLLDIEDSSINDIRRLMTAQNLIRRFFPSELQVFNDKAHQKHPYSTVFESASY